MNDVERIADIFGPQHNGKRLIWNGFKPDGTKNQYWQNQNIDWEKHLSGELKQGGNLACDGMSKAWVIDIDQTIDSEKIGEDSWNVDNKAYPFLSPSKRWHIWKFWHKAISTKDIVEDRKRCEQLFKSKKYKIDYGHSLPKENGSLLGINFPFNDHQLPYDPRGMVLTRDQFIHRVRFQNYPLISAATGMKQGEGGRPTALLKIAALLEQKNKFQYLDDVIKNFGDEFTDTEYIKRIKEEGLHKKYINIGYKGLSEAISDVVGFDYKLKEPEHEPPPNFWEGSEEFEDIVFNKKETKELIGYDIRDYRMLPIEKPVFIMERLFKERSINFLFGPKGNFKTEYALGITYAMAHGISFLNYKAPLCYPVLYIDGEMDPYDIIEREAAYLKAFGEPPKDHLHIINFAQQTDQIIPDIREPLGQELILNYLRKQEKLTKKKPFLILDNLRSLSNYIENDSDSFRPIGTWLKNLRGLGYASLTLDHTGHNQDHMRGTSSKSDWANVCLKIQTEGKKGRKFMKVRLKFDKARGLKPDETDDFIAVYDFQGNWTLGQSEKEHDDDLLKKQIKEFLMKKPQPTQKNIALYLKISAGKVNKLIKEIDDEPKDSNSKEVPF